METNFHENVIIKNVLQEAHVSEFQSTVWNMNIEQHITVQDSSYV